MNEFIENEIRRNQARKAQAEHQLARLKIETEIVDAAAEFGLPIYETVDRLIWHCELTPAGPRVVPEYLTILDYLESEYD